MEMALGVEMRDHQPGDGESKVAFSPGGGPVGLRRPRLDAAANELGFGPGCRREAVGYDRPNAFITSSGPENSSLERPRISSTSSPGAPFSSAETRSFFRAG